MEENKEIEITLEEKLLNAEEKYIRKCAELENFKKRVLKEKEELISETKIKTLSSVLDIDNDLTIAIKNISNEEAREGVLLISKKLENFLKQQGIEEIQTDNYDPDYHEVISVMNIGEDKIIDVVSKGYTLNGKIFRYPKIVLGK